MVGGMVKHRQQTGNQLMHDGTLPFDFVWFHGVMEKMPVKHFSRREPRHEHEVVRFAGQLVDGIFHGAVAFVLPSPLLGNGGDGVVGGPV